MVNSKKNLILLLKKKLNFKNNFGKNYISFIKINDSKLHRGLKGNKFKDFIKKVFNIEVSDLVPNTDWEIFLAFIEFRHAIAHSLKTYKQKKDALTLKINDTKDLLASLEKILTNLDNLARIRLCN